MNQLENFMKLKQFTYMKSIIILLLSFLPCIALADDAALTSLKNILAPIHSLQGNFQQKIVNDKGKTIQQSQGKMWVKKPGFFRWEVSQQKDRHLTVSDGKQIYDYDQELAQVTIQKLRSNKGGAPIYFLTGEVNTLGQDFQVKNIQSGSDGKCLSGSDACFELKPKASGSNFNWIRVGFSGKNLKEIELQDHFGQRSLFQFVNLTTNGTISNQLFQFTPPKGVDVVRN